MPWSCEDNTKKHPDMSKDLGSVILHQDNELAHTAHTAASTYYLEIDLLGFYVLDHLPYSPDLAPMDFAIFPLINSHLKGEKFVSRIDSSSYSSVFNSWLKKCEKCIQCGGDYIQK